jgi:sulfate-transporting ATPase
MLHLKPGQPLYSIQHLKKTFGDRVLLEDVTFWIYPGDRIGILGYNGVGKSTLMKILSRQDLQYEGSCAPATPDLKVGCVEQEPQLDPSKTVRESIDIAVEATYKLLKYYDELNEKMADINSLSPEDAEAFNAEYSSIMDELEAKDAWDIERRIERAMIALRLPPPTALIQHLSGGEKRRVALCQVLMSHPDLLILDEPTNHLDTETVEWLEEYLRNYTGTYILVTHDRYFLDNVANRMLELDRGRIQSYKGNYSDFLEQKEREREIKARGDSKREDLLAQELEWVRSTPAARRTKSAARMRNFEKLEQEVRDARDTRGELFLEIPPGPRLGGRVIWVEELSKSYGDKVLFKNLTFEVPRGGILGITGANGLGKSTLIKILMGTEKPDSGIVGIGKNTSFCYIDQTRDTLDPEKTVFEEISQGDEWVNLGKKQIPIRNYLTRFLFKGSLQQALVKTLSGGERNRVLLAKQLRFGGNVLVFDEPTNDLDLQTLRILEEGLLGFPGSAIVITHDRYFLDRVASHILAFEGSSYVHFTEGSYEIYKERKKQRDEEAGLTYSSKKSKHTKMVK